VKAVLRVLRLPSAAMRKPAPPFLHQFATEFAAELPDCPWGKGFAPCTKYGCINTPFI
jgi:hypothetical protein